MIDKYDKKSLDTKVSVYLDLPVLFDESKEERYLLEESDEDILLTSIEDDIDLEENKSKE